MRRWVAVVRTAAIQTGFTWYWGRLPGQVWTLALWAFASGIVSAYLIALRGLTFESTPLAVIMAAGSFAVGFLLLILGQHTPSWLVHALLIGLVIRMGVTTASTQTAVGLAVIANAVLILAIYTALWFSRRAAWSYVAFGMASYTIGAWISGYLREAFIAWVVAMSLTPIITQTLTTLIGRLQQQATRDQLTGLLNRAGFTQLLALYPAGGRLSLPRAVVVVDLDHFKQINDTQGHLAGDAILRAVADSFRATLRADDIAVRFGGDEFVLLLPQTDRPQAEAAVRRLRQIAPAPWSHGIADWGAEEPFEKALARADAELYQNKAAR